MLSEDNGSGSINRAAKHGWGKLFEWDFLTVCILEIILVMLGRGA